MIEKMHERTNGPVFKIIFALVSISFVLGGVSGTLMSNDANVVAKVNGEKIDQRVFANAKSREQNARLAEMGDRFWDLIDTPEYAKQFNQDILNGLVNEQLLRQYIQDLKLGVSADQIKAQIVNDPSFQRDGKFSNDIYQTVLRQNNLSADSFASLVAEGILASQVQSGIFDTQFSTPAEQSVLAKLLLQKRDFSQAVLSLAQETAKQSASAEEVQAYFDAHKADFVEPEKLKVDYFTLSPESVAKTVQVGDAEVSNYYEQNKAQFVTVGEARLAHIQVSTADEGKQLESQLQAGGNFEEIAKAKSADKLSAAQGGDLGWAKAGVFPAAFEQAANALQVGQVSQPVQIDGAFHIIKVLERKPSAELPLEQVKAQIAERLRQEMALAKYSDLLNEIREKAAQLSTAELAQLAGAKLEQTAQFTQNALPEALNNPKILNVLYAKDFAANGELSEAIDLSDASAARSMFIKVSDYQAARPQTFDEAKAAAEVAVKREKAEKAITAQADEMVAKLVKGEKVNITFSPKQTAVYLEAEMQAPFLAKNLFTMPKPVNGVSYKASRADNGDMVILALDKVTDGEATEFKQLATTFEMAERAQLRNVVISDLRDRASVEFNEEALEQQRESH